MRFEEELKRILQSVPGSEAAILMGTDGIPVAEVRAKEYGSSMSEPAVEYSQVLQEASKVAQGNSLGTLQEIVVATDRHRIVLRYVSPSYFVGLMLSDRGNLGKGRYMLRRVGSVLERDL